VARIAQPPAADRRAALVAEEREARERHRRLERARRARAAAVERERRQRLAAAIAETLKRWPGCRCELRTAMTSRELRDLGGGCTHPLWVCPRLDAVRRRVGL
jgi:hypothetical protein